MSKLTARLFCWRDEIEKIPMGDLTHPFVLQRVAAVPHGALCGDCALLVHGAHHPRGQHHSGNPRRWQLRPGDIIVFRHEGETVVKRIVAVGGDTVSLNDRDGSFAVNQELATATRILIVPKDYFFVVGDNRQNSFDSRFWEEPFVGVKWVLARVRA